MRVCGYVWGGFSDLEATLEDDEEIVKAVSFFHDDLIGYQCDYFAAGKEVILLKSVKWVDQLFSNKG